MPVTEPNGSSEIKFTTKELLTELSKQITGLSHDVRTDINGLGQRISRVEDRLADRLPLLDALSHRLDGGDQNVTALVQRVSLHEANDAAHPATAKRLSDVEEDVRKLKEDAIGSTAVNHFKRQMWAMIGLNGAGLLTAALALYKVLTGHP